MLILSEVAFSGHSDLESMQSLVMMLAQSLAEGCKSNLLRLGGNMLQQSMRQVTGRLVEWCGFTLADC